MWFLMNGYVVASMDQIKLLFGPGGELLKLQLRVISISDIEGW